MVKEKKHFVTAGLETLLTNTAFTAVTGYVFNFSWAKPTAQTMRENLTLPWIWEDTDGFKVNQIGHPYQGSLYFTAGRSNGFNFYESLLFTSLGSFTWEAFGERQIGAYNDLVVTTFGSASIGEMLHLLYLEACAAGVPWPIALFVSPMDGINRFVTGRKPPEYSRNLYELSVAAFAGYSQIQSAEKTGNRDLFAFHGPSGGIGLDVIYGNPFEQNSSIPYHHFEVKALLAANVKNYFDMRVISDGYLLSFSPVDTEPAQLSCGLSLHFDFVSLGRFDAEDSDIDQYSNALDWSVKYRRLLTDALEITIKAHGGGTFFGVSEYYSPFTEDQSLKNYGAGVNLKLSFEAKHETLGRAAFNLYQYYLWSFPQTVPFSRGQVFWLFADASYSRRMSKSLSLGITASFALEKGWFTDVPNTDKYSFTVTTFIKKNFG